MKKISVAEWLNEDDETVEQMEILEQYYDISDVGSKLLNFDRVTIYDGYTKLGLGEEIAWSMGIDGEDGCKKYFDYEKFADDMLEGDEYVEIEADNKYSSFYDEDILNDKKIFLGKFRSRENTNDDYTGGQFMRITKHSWDCNWYWGFGYIGNSGMHTHLDSYLKRSYEDLFEHTWIKKETWDKFRLLMIECFEDRKIADAEHNKDDAKWKRYTKDLEAKLDKAWNVLFEEYNKIELILEGE